MSNKVGTDHQLAAANFTAVLWGAVVGSGGSGHTTERHFPGAYDSEELAGLPLPIGDDRPSGQPWLRPERGVLAVVQTYGVLAAGAVLCTAAAATRRHPHGRATAARPPGGPGSGSGVPR